MLTKLRRWRWVLHVFAVRWRIRAGYLWSVPRVYRNWWAWPLPKLGVGVVLELRGGARYYIRPHSTDLSVVNEAVILDPYLRSGYIQLPANSVIVDVGANIGDFAVQLALRCPRGCVYAVEPLAENVKMIALNSLLNDLTARIQVVPVALGAQPGESDICVAGNASSAYFVDQRAPVERVRVTTLPLLMADYNIEWIDLLKLDCEGAEWDVFPACEAVLPKIGQICMEYHTANGWTGERLAEWLQARGFETRISAGPWNGALWARSIPLAARSRPEPGAQAPPAIAP